MPFNVDSPNPADDAIVSQFPANERNSRRNIEDWMDFEHNKSTGRHKIPRGTTAQRDNITDWSEGSLWINTDTTPNRLQIQTASQAPFAWTDAGSLPPGVIVPYAGSSVPDGWLLCNGQAVSRTTYAALFSVIGTQYGSGDGLTTFNVPDLCGRVIAGLDNMGGVPNAGRLSGVFDSQTLGSTGGDQWMQKHTHTFSGQTGGQSNDHQHPSPYINEFSEAPYGSTSGPTSANVDSIAPATSKPLTGGVTSDHTHPFSGTTDEFGSGNQQNVQPTMVMNFIIKT